jgi:hypothetical protein
MRVRELRLCEYVCRHTRVYTVSVTSHRAGKCEQGMGCVTLLFHSAPLTLYHWAF